MRKKKQKERRIEYKQEKTKAAAAPRKPKKGAVSSPLKVDAIVSAKLFLEREEKV